MSMFDELMAVFWEGMTRNYLTAEEREACRYERAVRKFEANKTNRALRRCRVGTVYWRDGITA